LLTTVVLVALGAAALPAAQAAPAPTVTAGTYVPVDKPVKITAIPGVVADGAKWEPVFSSFEVQDGIVAAPDGGILIAMQEADIVRHIDARNVSTIYVGGTHGAGALAMDNAGRLYAITRKAPTTVAELAPSPHPIAPARPEGAGLGRLSDLVVDLKGGYYVTGGSFFYVSPQGTVTTFPADLHTNGIALSPDGKTLYVTNETELVAFDVQADGSLKNRRVFNTLDGDAIPDGMTVDAAGRVYVACLSGVHVISPDGRSVGVIPTPRRGVALAFAGPGKKTLDMIDVGANATNGKRLTPPTDDPAKRGETLYRLRTIASGYRGRPK
jgi:gluconolactonase